MTHAALAGPRRTRPAPPMRSGPPPLPAAARAAVVEAISSSNTMLVPRPRRARWFLLGLAFGAAIAIALVGDGRLTLRDLRDWSARTLRRLEHHTASVAAAATPVVASPKPAEVPGAPAQATGTATATDCAELLAPFATKGVAGLERPAVPVESLPRADRVIPGG